MPRDRPPSPPKLEYTAQRAREEQLDLHRRVGHVLGLAIVTSAVDVVPVERENVVARLLEYIEKVEGMPEVDEGSREEQARREQISDAHQMIATLRDEDEAVGVRGAEVPRLARGVQNPSVLGGSRHSSEVVSATRLRKMVAQARMSQPKPGRVTLRGKLLVDPLLLHALHDAVLHNVNSLTQLALPGCELGGAGVAALAPCLTQHPTLTSLDLSDNSLDPGCLEVLVEALLPAEIAQLAPPALGSAERVGVRRLDLRDNQIGRLDPSGVPSGVRRTPPSSCGCTSHRLYRCVIG